MNQMTAYILIVPSPFLLLVFFFFEWDLYPFILIQSEIPLYHDVIQLSIIINGWKLKSHCLMSDLGKKTMYITGDYVIQKLDNCWYEYCICDFM
jgi:hypothetical protein